MASKKELAAVKELLESLHAKVDALSEEVTLLRAGGASPASPTGRATEAGPAEETPEEPASAIEEPNPALDVVIDFVAAALLKKDEACWTELERLTHSGALLAPRSLDHLKAFSWKKLRVNARRYFKSRKEIRAERIEPETIEDSTELVKVFVAHGKGASSPLTVSRDSEAGGDWRVQTCSL